MVDKPKREKKPKEKKPKEKKQKPGTIIGECLGVKDYVVGAENPNAMDMENFCRSYEDAKDPFICTITKGKATLKSPVKGRKAPKITFKNIKEMRQMNYDLNRCVAKLEKKKQGQLFAMKFENEEDCKNFMANVKQNNPNAKMLKGKSLVETVEDRSADGPAENEYNVPTSPQRGSRSPEAVVVEVPGGPDLVITTTDKAPLRRENITATSAWSVRCCSVATNTDPDFVYDRPRSQSLKKHSEVREYSPESRRERTSRSEDLLSSKHQVRSLRSPSPQSPHPPLRRRRSTSSTSLRTHPRKRSLSTSELSPERRSPPIEPVCIEKTRRTPPYSRISNGSTGRKPTSSRNYHEEPPNISAKTANGRQYAMRPYSPEKSYKRYESNRSRVRSSSVDLSSFSLMRISTSHKSITNLYSFGVPLPFSRTSLSHRLSTRSSGRSTDFSAGSDERDISYASSNISDSTIGNRGKHSPRRRGRYRMSHSPSLRVR